MYRVSLLEEVEEIIFKAVCQWSGIVLTDKEAHQRTTEISVMIDGAGATGPRNWRGLLMRARTEHWLRELIRNARAGRSTLDKISALYVVTTHRDANGGLLEPEVAAVELFNILRLTEAIARYILFAAIAMENFPACREKVETADEEYIHCFVQEVRRYYPFFPFVGGIVKQGFDWRNYHFKEGTRIMLDIYGTNRDARIWQEPEAFKPERFRAWKENKFTLIPQGGGDFFSNHRCAGEWITIELMKRALHLLTRSMDYDVVPQNLEIDSTRMPALPKDPFIIRNARKRDENVQIAKLTGKNSVI